MQSQDTAPSTYVPLFRYRAVCAYARIDQADEDLVTGYVWRLHSAGYAYRWCPFQRHQVFMHRTLLGLPVHTDGREGDHRNRDRLDNRRSNLRIATHAQNMQNPSPQKGRSSSYRGVYWHRTKQCWIAQVKVRRRAITIGRFADEDSAAAAAAEARAKILVYATD